MGTTFWKNPHLCPIQKCYLQVMPNLAASLSQLLLLWNFLFAEINRWSIPHRIKGLLSGMRWPPELLVFSGAKKGFLLELLVISVEKLVDQSVVVSVLVASPTVSSSRIMLTIITIISRVCKNKIHGKILKSVFHLLQDMDVFKSSQKYMLLFWTTNASIN